MVVGVDGHGGEKTIEPQIMLWKNAEPPRLVRLLEPSIRIRAPRLLPRVASPCLRKAFTHLNPSPTALQLTFLSPPPWLLSCPITPPLYPSSIVIEGPRPPFSQATSTHGHMQETSSPASSTAFRPTKRWRRTSSLGGTRRRKRGREIARENGPKLRRGCDRRLRKLAYLHPRSNQVNNPQPQPLRQWRLPPPNRHRQRLPPSGAPDQLSTSLPTSAPHQSPHHPCPLPLQWVPPARLLGLRPQLPRTPHPSDRGPQTTTRTSIWTHSRNPCAVDTGRSAWL